MPADEAECCSSDLATTSGQHVEYWEPSGVVTTMWVSLSLVLGVLAFLMFGLLFTLFGKLPEDESLVLNWPVIGGLTIGVLAAHQLLHAAVAKLRGGSPRMDLDVIQLVFPVMYCRVSGQYFSRSEFLVYLLTPLVVPSLLGIALMPLDERAVWLTLPLAANSALALRDLWMARIVWSLPPGSSVRAERDGMTLIRPG